eukprot:3308944-Pyramimonas_sp.AAC.1
MDFPAKRRVAARVERHEKPRMSPHSFISYGHPDYGGYWGQHCEGHVISQGFITCSPWRSCYVHTKLRFLIAYVDDFKFSGPRANLEKGWRLLQDASEGCPKGIEIDPPTNVG